MNWKKLEALYGDAFETGNKEKCAAYLLLVLDELRKKQRTILEFSGGDSQ
jgi:hypothetical protein